jgi:hypothetical protein
VVPITGAIQYPPDVAAVDGLEFGTIRLQLPQRAEDFVAWADLLSNCLRNFVRPAHAGESIVIGVRNRDALVGALELDRSRRLRQFVGNRNRPLPDTITVPVLAQLSARGVLHRA